jgi:chromosomal replication initiator protein
MESVWEKVKASIRENTPSHAYHMWIEPLKFIKSTGDRMVLACPNSFIRKRIIEHFGDMIQKEIHHVAGPVNFLLEVAHGNGNGNGNGGAKSDRLRNDTQGRQLLLPKIDRPKNGRMLRRDFTFDRFVVGKNCEFAYAASLSLASQKSPSHNALFLLSPIGMGKSHLAQAAGHQILSMFPGERVFYITAEDFTNEMVAAFKDSSISEFKNRYRSCCDVLLLEDIHLLSNRTRTQEELALILDDLYESGRKIIYSSNTPLSSIPKMSEKLKSRIAQSLISEIEPPDFRTRVRILQYKARERSIRISDDILEYIASLLTDNVRMLESGLMGVATKSCLLGVPVDLHLAESVIRNIANTQKTINLDLIKKTVCAEFNISVKDIESASRKQIHVRPRQIAMYLSRRHTDQPIQVIGQSFRRYHATVIYAINAMEKEMRLKGELYRQVEIIEGKLLNGKGKV